ncbi:hypothetical protein ONS95_008099 [Cadophora gregata]|uniref:uncharacterized protein n=1 Tax=Cadophora gregata TaxID=51156 RepID=UPI0026DCEA41|nr:uncharacterized protein ONS95_008099 [Cadophora gregata]KAK0126503.1 hypothetical protein ONS95_008099 [Cadophora gregata]
MSQIHEYYSLKMQENRLSEQGNWENEWSHHHPISTWETTATTPTEVPLGLWQYTAAALNSGELGTSYFAHASPISPHPTLQSTLSSTTNSPRGVQFPSDGRFAPLAPTIEQHIRPSKRPTPPALQLNEDDEMDEDSDEISWEPRTPIGVGQSTAAPVRPPMHRRVKSSNEVLTRDAKRAHTVVERSETTFLNAGSFVMQKRTDIAADYRERLNDKIAELGLYLFETSSDSRTKPSKSLVMTRAKERLEQLEARNKALEEEVTKLRQHIAILDHVVSAKGEQGLSTPV